jgi:hypothetical protein
MGMVSSATEWYWRRIEECSDIRTILPFFWARMENVVTYTQEYVASATLIKIK